MAKLTILVGPPGSGKTTYAKELEQQGYVRVSQDDQGKFGYMEIFRNAVSAGKDIVVDRMNFSVAQRADFMAQAPNHEYEVIVFHQPYAVCLERVLKRADHPTIKDEKSARAALRTFFTKYERPWNNEFLKVKYLYPETTKPHAVVCDLDGTLCNVEHRRHFVRTEGQKKDWGGFFRGIADDTVNEWCETLLRHMADSYKIVYCSGRGNDYRDVTETWLNERDLLHFCSIITKEFTPADLYMRSEGDSRQDYLVKEILLDFEILTRYEPIFFIDDRKQVVDMWRSRGFVCLQCDPGEF